MAGFKKATKEQAYATIAIEGPSGSGKTWTAAELAKHLCPPGKQVYHIDSERGSASKYAHVFSFLVDDDFGPTGKVNYHPDVWIKKMTAAIAAGDCGVLILDTPTHMWKGEGGVLSVIEQIKKAQEARGKKADGFNAWADGDKLYRKFMDTLLSLPCHRIMTLRSKTKYEKAQNDKGYMEVKKIGLEAEMRDAYEFEVDLQCQMTHDHTLVPMKHRLGPALDGKVFPTPGKEFADIILDWVNTGAPKVEPAPEGQVALGSNPPVAVDTVVQIDNTDTFALCKSALEAASTANDLAACVQQIKKAKADGLITAEQNKELSTLFAARTQVLKGAAA